MLYVHRAEHHSSEAACVVWDEEAQAHVNPPQPVLVVSDYGAWLSEVGAQHGAGQRLTWKERKLGKEVPPKLRGRHFEAADKKEIERWFEWRFISFYIY